MNNPKKAFFKFLFEKITLTSSKSILRQVQIEKINKIRASRYLSALVPGTLNTKNKSDNILSGTNPVFIF